MPTLRDLGEFEAIRRLTRQSDPGPGVIVGAGDDAAVLGLEPGHHLVATTDAFVENRHYRAGWLSDREIGSRLAVANLTDLAAMAASPRWALFSIGARPDRDVDTLVELARGLRETLAEHGAVLVGGNLAAVEGPEWLSATLLGETPAGRAWTRGGARPGDLIAVTGAPGRAAAGVRNLARDRSAHATWWKPLEEAWRLPRARIDLALALAEAETVTAAIDVSDGLAADLAHLCEASRVGADLEPDSWPRDPLLERAAAELGLDFDALRFGASDDYELLLAVDPARQAACAEIARAHGVPLAIIGRFSSQAGALATLDANGLRRRLDERGYDHFRSGPEAG